MVRHILRSAILALFVMIALLPLVSGLRAEEAPATKRKVTDGLIVKAGTNSLFDRNYELVAGYQVLGEPPSPTCAIPFRRPS